MTTIRVRLTVWYTVALTLTMLVFAVVLVLERRNPSPAELDERLAPEADFAINWLEESHRILGQVTLGDTAALAPSVSGYLEGVRDLLMVSDQRGNVLFTTEEVRRLSYTDYERLAEEVKLRTGGPRSGSVMLSDSIGEVRYLITPVDQAGEAVGAVLVATPVAEFTVPPVHLIRSMALIAPLIIAASALLGYWLAPVSLQPLERIMDELEEISDGRSLHRRLMVPRYADELARLAMTVNGMLARLEQSFASLRRFTADASHELKTPLMVVRAGLERSLADPSVRHETLAALDETLEQLNRMTELVENLLTLARMDERREALAMEDHDLRPLISEAVETAGMLGEAAGIEVRSGMPDHPVVVAVDYGRIRQLVLNLVTNAIKYTPPGGEIELGLLDEGRAVRIVVRDSGIGITAGDLPHIFDRFWRADVARTRTGDQAGFGLGLAICKWIAEAHGGSIVAQSRPTRGTVFTVTLPRVDGDHR